MGRECAVGPSSRTSMNRTNHAGVADIPGSDQALGTGELVR
jgi:hypothetical protein